MQVTTWSPEQAALLEVLRNKLERSSSPAVVRASTDAGRAFDPELWASAAHLGWLGLEAPEAFGGSGQTFVETSLVLRELGRAATPGPFLSQVLAIRGLVAAGDPTLVRNWLEPLVAGEAIGAVAIGERDLDGRLRLPIRATRDRAGWVLSGTQAGVLDIGLADLALVAAHTTDGPLVVAIPHPQQAVASAWRPTHDRTRRVYDMSCDELQVSDEDVLAAGASATELLRDLWARGITGVALDAVGGARRVVDMTVEYTSQRVQFGRPIATFQAVKHTCVNMYVEAEVARVATDAAVLEIASGGDRARYWAATAKFRAADAYATAAGDALQMHGGIGMTWEFDLHLWLKRAKLNQVLLGSSDSHRARIARRPRG